MQNQKKRSGGLCVAVIGGNTAAIRAERMLRRHGIPAEVKKLEEGGRFGGCYYGVSYPCAGGPVVASVLAGAGIAVLEHRRGS